MAINVEAGEVDVAPVSSDQVFLALGARNPRRPTGAHSQHSILNSGPHVL